MSDTAPLKGDTVEFLSLLTEPKRRQVLQGSTSVRHPAGTIAHFPDQPDYVIVVRRGLLRVYAGHSGRQATIFYLHRGELLSRGLVMRPGLNAYVQAVTEVDTTHLDMDVVRRLARADVEVAMALMTYYGGLVVHAARIIAVRSLGDITARVAFDILDRACANQLMSGHLAVRASQQQLADSIGSVREVVARSLRKLRDAKILQTAPNLVRVLDVERLEQIATNLSPD